MRFSPRLFILLWAIPPGLLSSQERVLFPGLVKGPRWLAEARRLEGEGGFAEAKSLLLPHLADRNSLGWAARWEWERMRRILLDFSLRPGALMERLQQDLDGRVTKEMVRAWRGRGTLLARVIDGKVRYFESALGRLYRLDAGARKIWEQVRGKPFFSRGPNRARLAHVKEVLRAARTSGKRYVVPKRLEIRFGIEVKAGAAPAGARLRCWLPFPRESARQRDIRLVRTDPPGGIPAPVSSLQRTVYLERAMPSKGPAVFQEVFQCTFFASVPRLDPSRAEILTPAERKRLAPWLAERPPHEVLFPEVRKIASGLCGGEKNPLLRAKKIYQWMEDHVTWVPAREYSTMRCIPRTCLRERSGDCGMQALLMICLLRAAGIPARWQSGWGIGAGSVGMHDWLRFYVKPWGWIHADPARGFIRGGDEAVRWFHFGSLDSYRLVVNDGWGAPLRPAKVHFRSEPVDFQRGEVEWEGGNLYFDAWTWKIDVRPAGGVK